MTLRRSLVISESVESLLCKITFLPASFTPRADHAADSVLAVTPKPSEGSNGERQSGIDDTGEFRADQSQMLIGRRGV